MPRSAAIGVEWSLMPCQYHTPTNYTPEQRLCYAILEDACRLLSRPPNHETTEAIRWFLSNDSEVFTFVYICEVLDTDPTYYRKRLNLIKPSYRYQSRTCATSRTQVVSLRRFKKYRSRG